MLAFECDYLEGAHEKILNRLIETNMEKLAGYGNDKYCAAAAEKILKACGIMHPQVQDFPLDITFEVFHVLIL